MPSVSLSLLIAAILCTGKQADLERRSPTTGPIVERGKPRRKKLSRAYFAEGSPAALELEGMLDHVGLVNVPRALSNIANAKAVYVAEHWQDCSRAKQWASDAVQVDTLADALERA